ncbi:MAG: ATP-binding protein, partial [Draconibacterium sp.]|nr:ATP-binding protein [Draconibacterium sp.]
VQAIVRDITERVQAERKIQESEARFKRLFEDLGDAVYVTVLGGENKGQILEANPAAVVQTGYSRSELLKMNILTDLYVTGTRKISIEEWEENISNKGIAKSVEKKRRKDGTEFWTEVNVTPIVFKGENASLSINRDITDRIKIEQDLLEALNKAKEADRLKSAFLASMSHEIRTPLNAIVGFSNLIAESVKDPKMLDFSSLINNQNDLLLNLVNDILDFAKIESGVLEITHNNFDLNILIDELFLMYNSKSTNDLKLLPQKTSESAIIYSDQQRIKQVFSNLIANSLKFTEKGAITFGYELNDNSEIVCFVKDTGIGIPKEKQESIFERFTKLDSFSQGTGLGLAISKNIVELHGGKIWLESEPGKGSVFYFTIPSGKDDLESKVAELDEGKKESTNTICPHKEMCTILVAEDDIVNFLYVKELLIKASNINVLHATNGLEAVELVETNDQIDLVLMDIKMPVMDGYEATGKIKNIRPQLPVIAVTAFALPEDEKKAKDAGCDDYLSKPIEKADLIHLLEKNLNQ